MTPLDIELNLDALSRDQAEAVLSKIQQIHGTLVSQQPANGYFLLGTFSERLAGIIRKFPAPEQVEDPQAPVEAEAEAE